MRVEISETHVNGETGDQRELLSPEVNVDDYKTLHQVCKDMFNISSSLIHIQAKILDNKMYCGIDKSGEEVWFDEIIEYKKIK
jgi:hypothetical protein